MGDAVHPGSGHRRHLLFTLLRILVATTALLCVYFTFPLTERDNVALGAATVVVGLTVFVAFFSRQLRQIRQADYPVLRAIEGIAMVGTVFVIAMASIHYALAQADPRSYTEPLSRLDALYFTVTTLTTVGFGDITPTTATTRAVTTVQMVLGLILVGAGVRLLLGVAQQTAAARRAPSDQSAGEAASHDGGATPIE
jgi:hypothetical protein